jgi:hypothetical protein
MPPPEVWGPPVWTMFHALAENVNEEHYNFIAPSLFAFFRRICMYLPCPDCAKDATRFLSNVQPQNITTKQGLINTMYLFHNHVNMKKRKPLFNFANITKYNGMNLIVVFNNFAGVYNTTGNMKLIAESFQRKMILVEFRKWFTRHIRFFIKPRIESPPVIKVDDTVPNTV